VRHDQDALGRDAAAVPQLEDLGAQRLAGEHVECGERFVHEQHVGLGDERAGDADALAHPARELARERTAEAREADQLEHLVGACLARRRVDALGLEPEFDVLLHRQPREQRERLEDHRDTPHRPADRAPAVRDRPAVGGDEPGHDAQQRRLARPRLAEQGDDLAFGEREVDAVEHLARRAVGSAKRLPDAAQFEQCPGHVDSSSGLRVCASSYSRRQKNRLRTITKTHITLIPSAMRWKSPASVVCLM